MDNINQAFSEVYDIINHLEEKLYNRIPKSFIEMLKTNKDNTYKPQIDYSISINEQELLKDTREILSLIYRDYICSPEKREYLRKIDIDELEKKEKEKRIKYNPNDIFKKVKKDENTNVEIPENNVNIALIEYKESFFTKFKNFVFKILHINR